MFINCNRLERFRAWDELRTVQLVLDGSDFGVPLVDVTPRVDERPEVTLHLLILKDVFELKDFINFLTEKKEN